MRTLISPHVADINIIHGNINSTAPPYPRISLPPHPHISPYSNDEKSPICEIPPMYEIFYFFAIATNSVS